MQLSFKKKKRHRTRKKLTVFLFFFHFSFHYVTALAVKFGLPSSGQQQQCRAS